MQSPNLIPSEDTERDAVVTGPALSAAMAARGQTFLAPLRTALDTHVDQRLVRTAAATVLAILRHRTARAHPPFDRVNGGRCWPGPPRPGRHHARE